MHLAIEPVALIELPSHLLAAEALLLVLCKVACELVVDGGVFFFAENVTLVIQPQAAIYSSICVLVPSIAMPLALSHVSDVLRFNWESLREDCDAYDFVNDE